MAEVPQGICEILADECCPGVAAVVMDFLDTSSQDTMALSCCCRSNREAVMDTLEPLCTALWKAKLRRRARMEARESPQAEEISLVAPPACCKEASRCSEAGAMGASCRSHSLLTQKSQLDLRCSVPTARKLHLSENSCYSSQQKAFLADLGRALLWRALM